MRKKLLSMIVGAALISGPLGVSAQDTQQAPAQAPSRLRVTTELVLVNVVARDKKGNLVRDLKKEDFTLFEDGKRQTISTFDFENVDELATGAAEATVSGSTPQASLLRTTPENVGMLNARDRRLMLLFFDFSAMQPEEIDRSVDAPSSGVSQTSFWREPWISWMPGLK